MCKVQLLCHLVHFLLKQVTLTLIDGTALAAIAWMYAEWWLLPIGMLVMFWGINDHCPIWQAVNASLKRSL
jgi:hypothetical protein